MLAADAAAAATVSNNADATPDAGNHPYMYIAVVLATSSDAPLCLSVLLLARCQ